MEVRQEVKDFAKVMEYKLICHDSKTQMATLGKEDIQWFIDGLLDEVEELKEAIEIGTARDIVLETADVANFAMMIMNIYAKEMD